MNKKKTNNDSLIENDNKDIKVTRKIKKSTKQEVEKIKESDKKEETKKTKQIVKKVITQPTEQPTEQPTNQPTEQPTDQPTEQPTNQPITTILKYCVSEIAQMKKIIESLIQTFGENNAQVAQRINDLHNRLEKIEKINIDNKFSNIESSYQIFNKQIEEINEFNNNLSNKLDNIINETDIEKIIKNNINSVIIDINNKLDSVTDRLLQTENTAQYQQISYNEIYSNITIEPYIIYNLGNINNSINISFKESLEKLGYYTRYIFIFSPGENADIILPNKCKYQNGIKPILSAGKTYIYDILNNLVTIKEYY